MQRELRPHQQKAYNYLHKNKGSGALFMEMRLGKTLVCIRFRKYLPGNVLVVAPVEGLWAWKRELGMENETYALLVGDKKQRLEGLKLNRKWNLINYEGVRTIETELKNKKWSALILDESRRIANPKAKTTKALQSFPFLQDQGRIVLSGEPAPEGPLEYFEQYRFTYKRFMGHDNYWRFRNHFFRELAPHEWLPKNVSLAHLKQSIRGAGFFLSRKEAGIPDKKIYETRTLQFPAPIKKIYNEIKKDFVASLEGKTLSTKWVPVQYLWLQQLASGWLSEEQLWDGKVKILMNLLKGELVKEQVVVWFRFNAALNCTMQELLKAGVTVGRIVGEDKRDTREDNIDRFRAGQLRVLLCQIKCGKTAIDLSCSSTAIYFTNSYSLEERKQSEDRILSTSKHDPLLYVDLVTEGTVEADVLQVLREKSGESKFYKTDLLRMLKNGSKTTNVLN